ncbi:hypothetical protein FT663_02462 [Candidozyma haemuli var. vulneris]|uniref:SRP9 domain-containing protein n=1 Tax=Candidozyma haemuli TaxID=45357 RepID=A0A2V1ARV4_9ASCO|nr:hypothetical protein CXQ85_002383 [[Candida] haemuloni]KAF3989892.1 hypothetical protein FT662_02570 [[Candida] haemuloni var. vulneris]KAF3992018.1 hypothetical protein FT663_02462 [[Candida] haemuloni var. vulneris]PVH20589.1 hypothetical protein CXQ85_002383 [[Candida] haemuloni]
MEKFIESSAELFEAFPSATVTITYSNKNKKKSSDNEAPANSVKFKCTEPKSGKTIQYSTRKAKELSRLLTYFGPRGVSKKRKADSEAEDAQTSKKIKSEVTGVASVMSNSKFEEPQIEPETQPVESTPAPEETKEKTPQPSSKSKKKKKGKKK